MRNERGLRFEREIGAWSGKSKQIARAEMKPQVRRFAGVVPSSVASIDPFPGLLKKSSSGDFAFSGQAASARTPRPPHRKHPPLPPLVRGV